MANSDDGVEGRDGDEVSEDEESSWLQRVGQSFGGVIFGIVLVIGACVLLFWNEGRAVRTARSLAEGGHAVQTVAADKIDVANEGKLIHVTGMLTSGGPVLDKEFGMRSSGVRLHRRVEMFQWTEDSKSESKKELGGSEKTRTTYKYERAWSEKPVDSAKFKERNGHVNPQMTYRARNLVAPQVKLGAFAVPNTLLASFGTEEALAVSDEQAEAAEKRLDKSTHVVDGVLYIAKDPAQPSVGDYRITFTEVHLQSASVVGQQAGSGFAPYRTQAGGTVQLIAAGAVPAADMIKAAEDENRMWTWIIRLGGVVLVFVGFTLMTGPLGTLADVVPILGDVVRAGTGLLSVMCTLVVAPLVIAIAWFVYRPVVAVIVLVVGAALAYGAIHLARQRKAQRGSAPA